MHPCPVKNCVRTVPDHHLMCGRHWRLVPEDINKRVYATWTSYQASRERQDLDKYRAARDEAIAAVETAVEASK